MKDAKVEENHKQDLSHPNQPNMKENDSTSRVNVDPDAKVDKDTLGGT